MNSEIVVNVDPGPTKLHRVFLQDRSWTADPVVTLALATARAEKDYPGYTLAGYIYQRVSEMLDLPGRNPLQMVYYDLFTYWDKPGSMVDPQDPSNLNQAEQYVLGQLVEPYTQGIGTKEQKF
jgi:hypothetical protein